MTASQPAGGVSPDVFRGALGRFATGVTVVTTMVDGGPHGMTANSFASASLVPPLVLVCVDRGALLHGFLDATDAFGVSVLGAEQQDISTWFAKRERPRGAGQFEGIAWARGPDTGVPLLHGAAATLECRLAQRFTAGDHSIYIGEVLSATFDTSVPPLLYLDGGYLPHPRQRRDA